MVQVVKLTGERPDKVWVGSELVEFDEVGVADVSGEAAEILLEIPHEYRLVDGEELPKGGNVPEGDAQNDEGDQTGTVNGSDNGEDVQASADVQASEDKQEDVQAPEDVPAPSVVTPTKRKAPVTTKQ